MTDTPKTDAYLRKMNGTEDEAGLIATDFARQLERELAEARKDAERLVEALEVVSGSRKGPQEFRSNSEWASYVLQMRDAARREKP